GGGAAVDVRGADVTPGDVHHSGAGTGGGGRGLAAVLRGLFSLRSGALTGAGRRGVLRGGPLRRHGRSRWGRWWRSLGGDGGGGEVPFGVLIDRDGRGGAHGVTVIVEHDVGQRTEAGGGVRHLRNSSSGRGAHGQCQPGGGDHGQCPFTGGSGDCVAENGQWSRRPARCAVSGSGDAVSQISLQ